MGSKFDFRRHRTRCRRAPSTASSKLKVGDKEVRLVEVGPAHTRGDVLAYVPEGPHGLHRRHPVRRAATRPVGRAGRELDAACDQILAWDVETVVPGHGPITDKSGVQAMKDYLEYINSRGAQALRRRHDASRRRTTSRSTASPAGATPSGWWSTSTSLYREFGSKQELNIMELFAEMGRFHAEQTSTRTATRIDVRAPEEHELPAA